LTTPPSDTEVRAPFLELAGPHRRSKEASHADALPEASLEPGPIRGTIQIDTNDPEFRRLAIPVSGRILDR